jgi:hypothetical protein
MFIRTIIFHNTITTILGLAKFLTVRKRRRFELISTSWKFILNTNPGLPATVALGHLWYNSGPYFVGSSSAAQSGTTNCQDDQDYPALRLTSGFPHIFTTIQSAHFYWMGSALSWATQLRNRNELSGQLSERHAFNLVRNANNGTVLNQHRQNHMSQPTHRLRPASIYITLWLYSTIANIANRISVSTYISQVIGNHPTKHG